MNSNLTQLKSSKEYSFFCFFCKRDNLKSRKDTEDHLREHIHVYGAKLTVDGEDYLNKWLAAHMKYQEQVMEETIQGKKTIGFIKRNKKFDPIKGCPMCDFLLEKKNTGISHTKGILSYSNLTQFYYHIYSHLDFKYFCTYCGWKGPSENTVMDHDRQHHKGKGAVLYPTCLPQLHQFLVEYTEKKMKMELIENGEYDEDEDDEIEEELLPQECMIVEQQRNNEHGKVQNGNVNQTATNVGENFHSNTETSAEDDLLELENGELDELKLLSEGEKQEDILHGLLELERDTKAKPKFVRPLPPNTLFSAANVSTNQSSDNFQRLPNHTIKPISQRKRAVMDQTARIKAGSTGQMNPIKFQCHRNLKIQDKQRGISSPSRQPNIIHHESNLGDQNFSSGQKSMVLHSQSARKSISSSCPEPDSSDRQIYSPPSSEADYDLATDPSDLLEVTLTEGNYETPFTAKDSASTSISLLNNEPCNSLAPISMLMSRGIKTKAPASVKFRTSRGKATVEESSVKESVVYQFVKPPMPKRRLCNVSVRNNIYKTVFFCIFCRCVDITSNRDLYKHLQGHFEQMVGTKAPRKVKEYIEKWIRNHLQFQEEVQIANSISQEIVVHPSTPNGRNRYLVWKGCPLCDIICSLFQTRGDRSIPVKEFKTVKYNWETYRHAGFHCNYKFFCSECDFFSWNKDLVADHMQTVHGIQDFTRMLNFKMLPEFGVFINNYVRKQNDQLSWPPSKRLDERKEETYNDQQLISKRFKIDEASPIVPPIVLIKI